MQYQGHCSTHRFKHLTLYILTSVCIFSLLLPIHFKGAEKENLFNNQEVLLLVIIFFTLMILMCDCGVILSGEIICLSPSSVKG